MFVKFCLSLLALFSLTAAADPECDELIKPLEDRNRIHGKWIYFSGTSDNKDHLDELRTINSSWIELSSIPDSEDMTLRWGDKVNGKCHYGGVNTTLQGNSTKVTFYFNSTTHEHVGQHLEACPDCIVWTDAVVSVGKDGQTRKGRTLYLFTKSGTLDPAHLENFKKQAACLNFTSDFHFGDTTNLCPDTTEANEEEQ